MESRVILHVDLDYFFAQCEERENPSLRNRPVVVCVYSGRTADSGAVSTTNYVARALGVKSGIPIAFAKRILKERDDAVFLPVNEELYERISESIMNLLRSHAERFEQESIDEAFLDISKKVDGDFEKAEGIGLQLKREIYSKERITCSVGIAPNKILAKVASDFRKPDGLTIVHPEEVTNFLWPLEVGKLYGVGKKTEKKMSEMGIQTMADLAKVDVQKLIETFGPNLGKYFHDSANGIDDEPVEEREGREQISRIATLKENTRDAPKITPELKRLAEEAHRESVTEGWKFRSVGVLAFMEDLTVHSRSRTLESPSSKLEDIISTSTDLLKELLDGIPDLQIRRIGVKVSNLSKQEGQKSLEEFLKLS